MARFALPRSTVYYWISDLPIPRKPNAFWSASAREKGTLVMQRNYRARREEAYESGRAEFQTLSHDPTFRDFVCLYLAEGYKRSRNSVSICNSDPAVMALAHLWIRRLTRNPVAFCFQYHADQDARKLKAFWAQKLGVDVAGIKGQRKSNSGQLRGRKWRCEFGVLTISSHDTLFRARLEAWMDCLRAGWT